MGLASVLCGLNFGLMRVRLMLFLLSGRCLSSLAGKGEYWLDFMVLVERLSMGFLEKVFGDL